MIILIKKSFFTFHWETPIDDYLLFRYKLKKYELKKYILIYILKMIFFLYVKKLYSRRIVVVMPLSYSP